MTLPQKTPTKVPSSKNRVPANGSSPKVTGGPPGAGGDHPETQRTLRILVLLSDAFGGHGGIAKFNRDLLIALSSHQEVATVVTLPRAITQQVEVLPDRVEYAAAAANGKLAFAAATLKAATRQGPFDLVICGHINLAGLAGAAAMWLRAPMILITHGVDAWSPPRNPGSARFAKRASAVISVSEVTRGRFLKWSGYKGPVHVLYNTIDLERFTPGRPRKDLVSRYGLRGKKVVMTLARLDERERYKGVDEILQLLPMLARDVPGIVYMIAGEGSDRRRLEDKAAELGVSDRVVFTGMVSEEEKVDHYRLADVFAMPGRGEGFGIVYLEALACGLPVVASTLDGSREAAQKAAKNERLGAVVNPDDPRELRAAILDALRHRKGHPPEGIDAFTFDNFRTQLFSIVESVAPGAARSTD